MCMRVLLECTCACLLYVSLVSIEIRRRNLDPMKLELQIIVSHHIGAGIQTQVFGKSAVFNHGIISAVQYIEFFFFWKVLPCNPGLPETQFHLDVVPVM